MLAALAIASGLFTSLFLGAAGEARLRANEGATPGSVAFGFDTELDPYLRFEAHSHQFDLTLGYAAYLTLADIEYGAPGGLQAFHVGSLSTSYHTGKWTFGAAVGGTFGETSFAYLTPLTVPTNQGTSGPQPVQFLPCTDAGQCSTSVLTFGSLTSSVVVQYGTKENRLTVSPSYSVSGGFDAATRASALLPLVSTPQLDVEFAHVLGRRDGLVTQGILAASDSTERACNPADGGPPLDPYDPNPPLCAPRAQWTSLRATWRHRFTRRLALDLTGGATLARTEIDPSQPYGLLPYPVVGVRVEYSLARPDRAAMHPVITDPANPSIYAYTMVEPEVDPFWGIVDPRLNIGVAVYHRLDGKHTFLAHGAFVRSLPPTVLDATYLVGDVEVLRRLDRYRFDAGIGLRGAYERDPVYGSFYVVNAFLTLIWHEPRIRF